MNSISISYRFSLSDGRTEQFDLQLDARSLEPVGKPAGRAQLPPPDWARLEFCQCSHCPLTREKHRCCPVALSLVDAAQFFDKVCSHDQTELQVVSEERTVTQRTTVQRGLSALLGLLIATSGCPHTSYLKPMARFHLPLASDEETVFRAVGSWLLARYFIAEGGGGEMNSDLQGLRQIYDNLHCLNRSMAERLRVATEEDSTVNAIILLDMFTSLMPFVIDERLEDIRHLFSAWLEPAAAAEKG